MTLCIGFEGFTVVVRLAYYLDGAFQRQSGAVGYGEPEISCIGLARQG
jgi:hypothetical protein